MATARVEVGLAHSPRTAPLVGLDGVEIQAIVQGILELPSVVADLAREKQSVRPRELVTQGRALARLWTRATFDLRSNGGAAPSTTLVEDGRPVLVLEYEPSEVASLPKNTLRIDPGKVLGAELSFAWSGTPWGASLGTWFLQRGSADPRQLRSLRLCILRLNAAQEALDVVIRMLDRNAIRIERDRKSTRLNSSHIQKSRMPSSA